MIKCTKIWAILVLITIGIAHSLAQNPKNPVLSGWYADPEGAILNGTYWIFPTLSITRDKQVLLDAFSSPDLITWTKHPQIIDTTAIKWAWKALWAPAIVSKGDKYYLFFAANDIQNDQQPGGIGIGISDKPEGPYKDYLGKPLLNRFINGAQPIDQFVFHDIDGQYYMIYGGWKHCNIVKLKDDFTGFIPFEDGTLFKEITPDNYVEGPVMFLRNGTYYFMWSEGDWGGPEYKVAYAMANTPFGPFKRIGDVLIQNAEIATGAGHNSVIHDSRTDSWFILYHRRPKGETLPIHRVTCIEKLEFDVHGFILPVTITE